MAKVLHFTADNVRPKNWMLELLLSSELDALLARICKEDTALKVDEIDINQVDLSQYDVLVIDRGKEPKLGPFALSKFN